MQGLIILGINPCISLLLNQEKRAKKNRHVIIEPPKTVKEK